MKLSEAIRLGATLRPQCLGAYRTARGTCALGAAAEAVREVAESLFGTVPNPVWPEVEEVIKNAPCPACGKVIMSSFAVVIHLNDHHFWSRERIADWVETHEPAPPPENPSPELLEYWADRSELFERSMLPSGISRED